MIQDKVKKFFEQFPITEYRRGDVIIFAHMSLSSVCYIESGTVVQYDINSKDKRSILNTFKAKAYFPMSNAVNSLDTPYFFEAEGNVKIRKAPANMVVKFVKENPDVLYDLLQRTFKGTDGLLAKMSEMMHGDAKSRILKEFSIMIKRFGADSDPAGDKLRRKITETELAERTGLARETVSRALSRLKAKGIIKLSRGYYVLAKN